ncbi:hypothetical protein NW768_004800 [Fusarium equiseti]|uniref:Uncharacterized protein n=1 Tax=Fusarium equiseti TaxID=61235 RepID=A0ABQ8RHA9_FUSEQ|nr:hypothetical protein NW768_004800 [Fusarium equiseti]
MSNHSYLPVSASALFSWPPRRATEPGPPEQSKTDEVVTIFIVCGIVVLFLAPIIWYLVGRILRARKERKKVVDVEQGVN